LDQDRDTEAVSRLARTARALEILTVVLVILVSPISFVVLLPFHIAPERWLTLWLKYVFIFVTLAVVITSAGFGAASSYRVRARMIRRSVQKPG
jgi:drug/metabolite transporter (DMT)-like permease